MTNNIKLKVTCEAAPTQVEGTAYDHPVYFRERHGVWAFGYWKGEQFVILEQGICEEFMGAEEALKLAKNRAKVYKEFLKLNVKKGLLI